MKKNEEEAKCSLNRYIKQEDAINIGNVGENDLQEVHLQTKYKVFK